MTYTAIMHSFLLLWVKAMFTQMGSPQSTGRDRGCVCSASNDPSDTSIPRCFGNWSKTECEVSAVLNFTPQIRLSTRPGQPSFLSQGHSDWFKRQTHDPNPANEIHLEFCVETIGQKNFSFYWAWSWENINLLKPSHATTWTEPATAWMTDLWKTKKAAPSKFLNTAIPSFELKVCV